MIPGIGASAFISKSKNYANIGLIYRYPGVRNIVPSQSYAQFSMAQYSVGDLILMYFESSIDQIINGGNNYYYLGAVWGNGVVMKVFYRIDDGTSNWFAFTNITADIKYTYSVHSNVDPITPFNAIGTSSQPSATTFLTAPAITTTRNKCLVINFIGIKSGYYMSNSSIDWANPVLSAFAKLADYSNSPDTLILATGVNTSAGNTGLTTVTYAKSTIAASITLALNPKEI